MIIVCAVIPFKKYEIKLNYSKTFLREYSQNGKNSVLSIWIEIQRWKVNLIT